MKSMNPSAAERIEWSRLPELSGVDLLLGERSRRPFRVYHQTYTVSTLLSVSGGDIEWTYRKKLYRAGARELALMQPGEVHANTRSHPPCDFRVLFIPSQVIERAASELDITPSQPNWMSGHCTDPALYQGFARLHASLESPASELERQSRFVTCLRLLLERCSETGSPSSGEAERAPLLRAREFIREHSFRPIALAELAAVSGLSRFHLVHAFAKAFGLPPHAYQLRLQIETARTLLAGGVTVAEAAAESGFADQSHLTRHFQAVYRTTPGKYRRACGFDLNCSRKNVTWRPQQPGPTPFHPEQDRETGLRR